MNIAIYSRKSKLTEKGESIENQIDMCSEYAKAHFENTNILVYEDEGYSGGNIDRPQFKGLIEDIKAKKIDVLMCYRLDRISRNVSDFSSTLKVLEKNNVDFVSIKEHFDTSTPMGRAMTYISSVFAQLERETIAERVRDNMLQLAKTGRWLGGVPPLGFKSIAVVSKDNEGKTRKQYKLMPVKDDLELVQMLFSKFIELGSLIKLETFLITNDIFTKKGKPYNLSTLKFIITNPVYLKADTLAYEYLLSNDYPLINGKEDFNGQYALMPYNRTTQATIYKRKDKGEWIVAIGKHEPIINSCIWITAQTIMDRNRSKSFRKVHSQEALLSGVLKCSCGDYMRPKRSRLSADGTKYHYYYICQTKEKSNGCKCAIKNLAGHQIDKAIEDEIRKLHSTQSDLANKFNIDKIKCIQKATAFKKDITTYQNKISENEKAIASLINTLSISKDTLASKYIMDQINRLGEETNRLQAKKNDLENANKHNNVLEINISLIGKTLSEFASLKEDATIETKRNLIRCIIEEAKWDGENLHIKLFGGKCLGEY